MRNEELLHEALTGKIIGCCLFDETILLFFFGIFPGMHDLCNGLNLSCN